MPPHLRNPHTAGPSQPTTPIKTDLRPPIPQTWTPHGLTTRFTQHTSQLSLPFVHRHIRTISGVIRDKTEVTSMTGSSLLGNAADEYLWTHGYQPRSVDLIQQGYEQSNSTEDFVEALAVAGMAMAEAHYLYRLITRQL